MLMVRGKLLGLATVIRGPSDNTWEAQVLGVLVKTGDLFDTETAMYLDVDDKEVGPDLLKVIADNTGQSVVVNLTVGGRAYKANVTITYRFEGFVKLTETKIAKAA
jgi:hypothetical protein